jgi:hypothetical protein
MAERLSRRADGKYPFGNDAIDRLNRRTGLRFGDVGTEPPSVIPTTLPGYSDRLHAAIKYLSSGGLAGANNVKPRPSWS